MTFGNQGTHERTKIEVLVLLFLSLCVSACILDSGFGQETWKETDLLAFCLKCFNCGAVNLSVFFFPVGVLERKG